MEASSLLAGAAEVSSECKCPCLATTKELPLRQMKERNSKAETSQNFMLPGQSQGLEQRTQVSSLVLEDEPWGAPL